MNSDLNQNLLIALSNLRKALKEDARIINLANKEKAMENSLEVQNLQRVFRTHEKRYNECLQNYHQDHPEVRDAQKALYLAKKAFDEHPLVLAYRDAYLEVQTLTKHINDVLFSPFIPRKDGRNGNSHHCR